MTRVKRSTQKASKCYRIAVLDFGGDGEPYVHVGGGVSVRRRLRLAVSADHLRHDVEIEVAPDHEGQLVVLDVRIALKRSSEDEAVLEDFAELDRRVLHGEPVTEAEIVRWSVLRRTVRTLDRTYRSTPSTVGDAPIAEILEAIWWGLVVVDSPASDDGLISRKGMFDETISDEVHEWAIRVGGAQQDRAREIAFADVVQTAARYREVVAGGDRNPTYRIAVELCGGSIRRATRRIALARKMGLLGRARRGTASADDYPVASMSRPPDVTG